MDDSYINTVAYIKLTCNKIGNSKASKMTLTITDLLSQFINTFNILSYFDKKNFRNFAYTDTHLIALCMFPTDIFLAAALAEYNNLELLVDFYDYDREGKKGLDEHFKAAIDITLTHFYSYKQITLKFDWVRKDRLAEVMSFSKSILARTQIEALSLGNLRGNMDAFGDLLLSSNGLAELTLYHGQITYLNVLHLANKFKKLDKLHQVVLEDGKCRFGTANGKIHINKNKLSKLNLIISVVPFEYKIGDIGELLSWLKLPLFTTLIFQFDSEYLFMNTNSKIKYALIDSKINHQNMDLIYNLVRLCPITDDYSILLGKLKDHIDLFDNNETFQLLVTRIVIWGEGLLSFYKHPLQDLFQNELSALNWYRINTHIEGHIMKCYLKNGKVEGLSTALFITGDTFSGLYRDDKINGYGVYTGKDSRKYGGYFSDGGIHGEGGWTDTMNKRVKVISYKDKVIKWITQSADQHFMYKEFEDLDGTQKYEDKLKKQFMEDDQSKIGLNNENLRYYFCITQLNLYKNIENDIAKQYTNQSISTRDFEILLEEREIQFQNGGRYEGTVINGKRYGVGAYFDSKGIGKYAITKNNKIVEWLRSFRDRNFNFDEFKYFDQSQHKQSDNQSFEWYMSEIMKGNINDELISRIIVKLRELDESDTLLDIIIRYYDIIFCDKTNSSNFKDKISKKIFLEMSKRN